MSQVIADNSGGGMTDSGTLAELWDEVDGLAQRLTHVQRDFARTGQLVLKHDAVIGTLTPPAASEPRVSYHFKVAPELAWMVLTALIPVMVAATSDLDKVMDWKVWAFALVAALVRAGGGALVAAITGPPPAASE